MCLQVGVDQVSREFIDIGLASVDPVRQYALRQVIKLLETLARANHQFALHE